MENPHLITCSKKKRVGVVCVLLLPLFFVVGLVTVGCRQTPPTTEYVLPDSVRLQTGDIVFRLGESRESYAVATVDRKGDYSHMGMVMNVNGQWMVLHAVPNERTSRQEEDSVKLEPVGVFFRSDRAVKGCIYRYPLSPEDTLRLLQKGLCLYGRHPLFDGQFDCEDTTSFYCSELVYFLYLNALGVDLTESRRHQLPLFPNLIFCFDIFQNPKLQEVFGFDKTSLPQIPEP